MQQEREEHIGQHKIDCGLAADHCFQGQKTMGLLLSRSHLHAENNGLQQYAVCILN